MEIEKEYKDSYEEIIESGVFRDPLNYYLVCVYPIKPFKDAESKPEEMFLNFKDEVALYFHIPFCQRRCSFCNFIISVSSKKDFVDQYLTALNKEAILVKNALQKVGSSPKIHSVYIGGGTPTYLEEAQIKFLLNKIIKENFNEYFPSDGFVELTMEASPGTLTKQKVDLLKDLGVNRISIGIQTFDDETLKLMNRDHDSNLAYQSIAYIGNNFNDRFNIVLISGLPIPKDWDRRYFFERLFKDLKIVIEKNIPSVTFYHLWTRGMENTLMMKKVLTGEWILPTRGEIVKLWIMINKILIEAGYKQEPTGWFIKSGNSLFKQQLFKWSEKYEYLGFGVSAYGYFNNYIYWNISKITDYINILNSDKLPIDKIRKISQDVDDRKRAVFSIKTTKGLNLSELNNKNLFLKEIEILKFLGLVQQKDNSIKLTEKGYVFFDEVSEFFFDEEDRKSIKKKLDIYTISRNRLNFLIRKCIVEKSEELKGSSYDFKEKWEKFLTIHLFPRIKDTLEFFLKQTLGEKYVRFLLAYIYIDDNDKVYFLKPYYSSHNEWYQNVILPWFQTKINENKAISLTQTFFEPPYKIVEPYFPPPFSLSLEFPVNSAADIKMIDIRKIRSELVDLLKSSSINSISKVFNQMYNDGKFNDKVLECLFNKSKRSATTLKNIFSQIETIILSRYPSKKGTKIFDDLEKNPWKLLPSLLAFLGNDDENVKHYIFIPLDLNEKCLPLVVVLELKDMIDDEEYKLVFDFFVSTFPIMTSFEERIRMEIKHDESLSHALRSAVAAIMARNMSHNIGSHVLAKMGYASFAELNLPQSQILYKYMQQRMDFVAITSTEFPQWSYPTWFLKEVMRWFYQQETLLEFIAKQEGIKGLYKWAKRKDVEENKNTFIISIRYNKKWIITENQAVIEGLKNDFLLAIPGGIIGYHSFYVILEGIIRNSAKHNWANLSEKEKKQLKITIDIENKDESDSITFRIYDNISKTENHSDDLPANYEKLTSEEIEKLPLHQKINLYLTKSFIDETGKIKKEHWGLQEMKISAGYLKKSSINEIGENGEKVLEIFKAVAIEDPEDGKYRLGYEFSIPKPKNVVIIGSNKEIIKDKFDNQEPKKHGIYYFENTPPDFDYEFMVLIDDGKNEVLNNLLKNPEYEIEKLPYRLFIVTDNDNKIPSQIDKRIVKINNNEFSNISNSDYEQFKINLYKKWIEKLHTKASDYSVYIDFKAPQSDKWDLELFQKCENLIKTFAKAKVNCINDDMINNVWENTLNNNSVIEGKMDPVEHFFISLDYKSSSSLVEEFKNSLPFFSITKNLPSIYEDENIQNFLNGDASRAQIKIKRHDLPTGCFYSEEISGSCTHYLILSNYQTDTTLHYQIIENAVLKILIIDERVIDYINSKSNHIKNRFKYSGIILPYDYCGVQIKIDSNQYEFKWKENTQEQFLDFNSIGEGGLTDINLLIIHQGIIDKMKCVEEKINPEEFVRKVKEKIPFVIITSGRGEPENVPKNAKFVPFSVIESTLLKDYHEKFILTQILMNLKTR